MKKWFFKILSLSLSLILIFTGIALLPKSVSALNFTEDFSTTNYKDNANTTADWNTTQRKLTLPKSGWTKADGITPGYDNVSHNSGTSNSVQFVLEANGRPNIIWVDDTTGSYDILFSKWNGSQWTKADGTTPGYDNVSNNSQWSRYPQIALDSNGRPNIVWDDYSTENYISFSKWNGSQWTKADGVTPGYDNLGYGGQPEIFLDSSQCPNILWDYALLCFSKWNGSKWTKADGATPGHDEFGSGGCKYKKYVLDSSQRPNIAWEGDTEGHGDIMFCKWNGATWTKADGITSGYDNISNNSTWSVYPQIAIDGYQRPNIVWEDQTTTDWDIFFSKWNGATWTKADSTTPGRDNISNNSSGSFSPQLVLDSNHRPNIVWQDCTPEYGILFSKWNGVDWTKADGTTLGHDYIGPNGIYPKIVNDSSHRPNVIWIGSNSTNDDIFFSRWNGNCWTKADGVTPGFDNVSSNSGRSWHPYHGLPQIALDSSQRPNIVWFDDTPGNYEVFFSKYSGVGDFATNAHAQSIKINNGTQNIIKASITVIQNLNGQTINYYLSANGGTNWQAVTPQVEHTFTHQGNDLRWKAVLSTTNSSVTPEIDSLTINYLTDTQKPTGSILINAGVPFAHSTQVSLSLQYADNVGVDSMIVSNNQNFSQASWETPKNTKAWTLPSGDEEKAVYAKFKDASGNESDAYLDSIYLLTKKDIFRLSGNTRYETAVEISKKGWNTSQTVVLARGDLFPDALSGAALAKKYSSPILLTNPNSLTKSTSDEIKRLSAKDIIILGSEDAIYPKVLEDLSTQCSIASSNMTRIGGKDRYETASQIAEQLKPLATDYAFIATGENYPDALSSASVSAFKQIPILLVRGDIGLIPDSTKKALNDLGIKNTLITGQTDVVPQKIEDYLKQNNCNPQRLGGETRYDTCKLISDWAKSQGLNLDITTVAVGENFPDALTLGPLAAKYQSPILLTRTEFIPQSIKKLIEDNKNNIYTVYIVGGTDVVSEAVKDEIWNIIK